MENQSKNKIKYDALVIQYMDPFYICELVHAETNDQDLGAQLRQYVRKCNELLKKDEPFPGTSKLKSFASCPSELAEKLEQESKNYKSR